MHSNTSVYAPSQSIAMAHGYAGGSLTNNQIAKKLRHVPGFRGAMCKDQLKRFRPASPGFYVLNLMNYNDGPGSHWVALAIRPGQSSVYVDSYGAPPPDCVVNFAATRTRPLWYSRATVQALDSEDCGAFAAYFVCQLAKNRTVDDIINKDFTSDEASNGRLVDRAFEGLR